MISVIGRRAMRIGERDYADSGGIRESERDVKSAAAINAVSAFLPLAGQPAMILTGVYQSRMPRILINKKKKLDMNWGWGMDEVLGFLGWGWGKHVSW